MECMIYLTHACNLKCTYCYEGHKKGNEYINLNLIDNVIDYILSINEDEDISISFLGGEPLLNMRWLYKFIDQIERREIKNISYKTTTNGTLLDKRVIDYFYEKDFQLSLSIDGDRESNELNRKPIYLNEDYYTNIVDCINYMNKIKYDFFCRMTVAKNTVYKLYDNVKYLFEMGGKYIRLSIDTFANWDSGELKILDDQLEYLDKLYLSKYFNDEKPYIDIYDERFCFFIPKRKVQFCSAGSNNHIVINSIGDIYPCSFVANNDYWKIGDIFTGIDRNKLISKIKESLLNNNSCKSCDIAYSCLGTRCGFYNFSKNGYLNGIDKVTCEIEKITNKHSKKVFQILLEHGDSRINNMIQYCIDNSIEMIL